MTSGQQPKAVKTLPVTYLGVSLVTDANLTKTIVWQWEVNPFIKNAMLKSDVLYLWLLMVQTTHPQNYVN
jgi:hypothetical protein